MTQRVLASWSGGKDSAMALHRALRDPRFEVVGLLTTVTRGYDRIAIHGVRRELLHAQAERIGLPVEEVVLSPRSSNAEYEERLGEALARARKQGVEHVLFGDLFLEDLRAYRDAFLAKLGLEGLYPLWNEPTPALARAMLGEGFRAILTCVDGSVLGKAFAGADFDVALLAALPASVDPCGERGEFHTFVHAAPLFARPIAVRRGEVVQREGRFWYADLLPA
jgi:uncharacterized protein (TIGR00290 family)